MNDTKLFKIIATYYDALTGGEYSKHSIPMPKSNAIEFLDDDDVKFDVEELTTEMPKAHIPSKNHMEELLDKEFGEDDESLYLHASIDNDIEIKSFDELPGGIADGLSDELFDEDELMKGQEEEMEHTSDSEIAKEIAKDHLAEDDEYYSKHDSFEDFLKEETDEEF